MSVTHVLAEMGEHTWHDFPIGEMSSEEIIIGCNILVANGILLALQLHYSVEQQKRKSAEHTISQRFRECDMACGVEEP